MNSPPISYRQVLYLAIPIILANLTQPLMSAVDTAVAGHLPGAQHLAGVALGSLLLNLIFWVFGFLRMGTTGVVAQYFGAGKADSVLLTVARGVLIASVTGLLILLLQRPLIDSGLALLGASQEASDQARLYANGRVWSAPLALINYVILGWLLGCQRVRIALAIQILINVVNLLTVFGFVYGLDWGVRGIGRATAVADFSGAAVGAWLLWRSYRSQITTMRWIEVFEPTALRRLILINSHIFIRTACLLATTTWFTHLGAKQGDALLAANAILLTFLSFTSYGLDGFAHAAETLSGAAVGQRKPAQLARVIRICLVWGLAGSLLYMVVYSLAGMSLIGLLTNQPDIAELASQYLLWAVLAPLVSMPAYLYDGVFIGATRTRPLMLIMLGCSAVFFTLSLTLLPLWGNHGLWLAFLAFNGLRGASLALALRPAIYRPLIMTATSKKRAQT
ncbi:MATE family efflux transporter [Paenalcaligenes niemegkensis]|uniref:MATE family efflux transporter n=1 Tax=Paenalcaligenes niemegkensis TaxID=2895469 RepID=UPI001EE7E759|nr:MATE family efflux transporter [Paenalcaligenes niemegkensis]MCQ9617432.1 MATE family efflux transporter [Paenalcaligenes niemegkensis]